MKYCQEKSKMRFLRRVVANICHFRDMGLPAAFSEFPIATD